jgi:cell division septum initiation protein DivIVA
MKVIASLVGAALTANAVTFEQSPVSRVVELLKNIEKTTEVEAKAEEGLYNKFVCWATTVIDTKTASNEVASKRIQEMETYIADIEAGRVEFTTERVDLEKELEELNAGIEAATALRDTEHEEFLSAEEEMKKGVSALDKAILVLKEATASSEGALIQGRVGSNQGFASRVQDAHDLAKAAELGEKVLTKGDSIFLRRLLSGEVPTADWKKLNRKATFKMGYKARSSKIQEVLAKLQQTFSTNLADAQAKEEKSQKTFDTLMEAKNAQKTQAEEALNSMESENGARGMNKEQAQDEVDALKTQVENDTKYIAQTKTSLADKKEEWKDRQTLRAGEQAAIAKAISILYSDDARDNFKKSFSSQGYLLLQMDARVTRDMAAAAATAIRQNAQGNDRLAALANLVASSRGSHFDAVLEAIDKMVEVLKSEEGTDLETKETCEADRAKNTRDAATTSRTMDETTEAISKLNAEIEEIKAEIVEKKEAIASTEKALEEATANREKEHAEWQATNRDDKEAVDTVKQAKEVLSGFYADNNLMLVQHKQKLKQEPGAAPPPPPQTFDAPYGGKTDESTSIIAILEMIAEDITKDISAAKAADDKAKAEYETFKSESESLIESLNNEVSELEGVQGDKEKSVSEKTQERTTLNEELTAVMKMIADAKPGCDFFAINYGTRVKNRLIEIDGLTKAKAILTGASFNAGPDPNREIKPGDAFLVRRHQQ